MLYHQVGEDLDNDALSRELGDYGTELLDGDKSKWDYPGESIKSFAGKLNTTICVIVNFIINLAIGYIAMGKNDYVGLFKTPDSPDPANSLIYSDWLITALCITFGTCLLSKYFIEDGVKKFKAKPTRDADLAEGLWSLFPLRVRNIWLRSLLLGAEIMILYAGVSIILALIVCEAGGFVGEGSEQCSMHTTGYIWLKAFWSAGCAALCYPLVWVSCLNTAMLPEAVYQAYEEHFLNSESNTTFNSDAGYTSSGF